MCDKITQYMPYWYVLCEKHTQYTNIKIFITGHQKVSEFFSGLLCLHACRSRLSCCFYAPAAPGCSANRCRPLAGGWHRSGATNAALLVWISLPLSRLASARFVGYIRYTALPYSAPQIATPLVGKLYSTPSAW